MTEAEDIERVAQEIINRSPIIASRMARELTGRGAYGWDKPGRSFAGDSVGRKSEPPFTPFIPRPRVRSGIVWRIRRLFGAL